MKISAFTFCKNIVKLDYPIVESIHSILSLVDEYIVAVGKSEDKTLELVQSINDDKIKIVKTVWDDENLKGGGELAVQANIALSHCAGDWAFYLQPDEVIHEDELQCVHDAMKTYLHEKEILAFESYFLHFTGDYWTLNPWDFHKEVRLIRNNGELQVGGDSGQIFRRSDWRHVRRKYFKEGVVPLKTRIFHYGWVKNPDVVKAKMKIQEKLWFGEGQSTEKDRKPRERVWGYYKNLDILKPFKGTHPRVMQKRVEGFPILRKRNRWFVPGFYREALKRGFKG